MDLMETRESIERRIGDGKQKEGEAKEKRAREGVIRFFFAMSD
jgi:hypothetical protein